MDPDASFGHWLMRRRHALRLSRAELARRVCCATITLRKIEEDARRPSVPLAARLAEQLSLPAATCATFVRVARGELRVDWLPPADQPVAPSPQETVRAASLPSPPTPLLGRADELAAVCAALLRNQVRLLTLSGAPGIGKTRLALQAASELRHAHAFADGVCFVQLAPLGDARLVLATIAQALGISEGSGVPLLERLAAYLSERQLLLVLDNFEHLLAAAPQLAALLGAAPQLTLLVTSQVALRLAGEQRYLVPPLAQATALELFVQRARAVQPDFNLTDANAPAVAAMCAHLDGLPLAIELAAARANLFTPQELLTRLDQRFALLTGGPLDLPARQQTLQCAIDWSYALLEPAQQSLFRQLAVFAGGWTLEAAEAVLSVPGATHAFGLRTPNINADAQSHSAPSTQHPALSPQPSAPSLLAALFDHSLIQRTASGDGQSRFTLLETLHAYARERLAQASELEQAQARHLAYYLALAEAAEPQLVAADQRGWLDRLEQEHDNLRAALAWALENEPAAAVRLAGALADFWLMRGYLSEGRAWLARVLDCACATTHASAAARAAALHGAGKLAHVQEDNPQAEALFAQGLALARTAGDTRRTALLLTDLGELALLAGDLARAASMGSEGLALARAIDDRATSAQLLRGLGEVAGAQGDLRTAAAHYAASLALCRALDDRRGSAWVLHALGKLALAQGEREQAAQLFAEGLAQARAVGERESSAWLLYASGCLILEQHDLAGAATHFAESARLLHALGASQGVALSLDGLAAVLLEQQQPTLAAQLLSAAEAQPWVVSVAAEHAAHDRTVALVRAQLDAPTFAAAWAAGRAQTVEQVVAFFDSPSGNDIGHMPIYLMVAVLGLAWLVVLGGTGGQLTYEYGVNVRGVNLLLPAAGR